MGTNLSKGRNREWLQRDVDRERRLRLDTEARLKGSSSEADRCRVKLSTLQKDFTKMEETVRSLLQYKSKFEQLKQDRHSVANSYENQILQLQNAITKLKIENETLKKQIDTLEATGISQVQKALVERLRILEHEKSRIEREGEQQRKQYERCLDDVAKQVVKAVLSQKGLREEISSLQHRVKELETGNCALSALLVQRLQGQKINYSPTTMPVAENRSVMFDMHRSPSVKMAIERPASCDLTKGLKRLKNDGWQAAVSYHRPQSLNLEICCSHNAEETAKCDRVLGDETPESGNRDEGYSTMSSDVQGTTEPPSTKGLEDVKEANENESNALMESSPCSRVMNSEDTDVIFVPLSLSFSFINPRHSYPPLRCVPAVQNIMRSYSDSHLFLKLAAATGGFAEDEDRTSWYSGGELWDMDYVQHWLRLDETRTAIQQRMEYDAAELEDWSMDDGTGTSNGWKRMSAVDGKLQQSLPCIEEDDATGSSSTSGGRKGDLLQDMGSTRDMSWYHFQQHHHHHRQQQSHQQHSYVQQGQNQVHNPHQHDCQQQLQHHHHHHHHNLHQNQQQHQQLSYGSGSPGGDSWSSADEYAVADTPTSKRSSVSCSADSIELLPPPGPIAGTDFTRDFYRLVKFESSKSLASTSSRSVTGGGCDHRTPPVIEAQLDRDQALQSVLDFIAEQQQYCLSRQAEDKREPPRAPSPEESRHSDRSVTDTRPQTPPPLPTLPTSNPTPPSALPAVHQTYDSNSCSDNLLNSKDSGLCGSDVEIECLPEDCSYVADQSPTAASTPLSTLLRTVVEEDEEASAKSTSPQPPSSSAGAGGSSSGCTADTTVCMVPAWAAASSKDLIDQLNWMDGCGEAHPLFSTSPEDDVVLRRSPSSSPDLDEACCCPTGWVHVERDIDFADPKERANLLDVMLAASRSSSSSTSTASTGEDDDESCSSGVSGGSCSGRAGGSGCNDTTDDSSDDECDPNDDDTARQVDRRRTAEARIEASNEESYNRLHRLHRVRRQKKASAIRDGFGVLRCPAAGLRQSIVGRSDFFVRFGDKEREAISNFDFLDDLSTTSLSTDSGDRPPSPRRPSSASTPGTASTSAAAAAAADAEAAPTGRSRGKYYSYTCSSSATAAAANAAAPGHRRPSASPSVLPADCRRQRRRRYSGLSLSDSCGDSD
uniref:Nck-associated protein 5 n=1 Tax=Melanaphis sacchari TaxID=742174 RepID=A0A2H8TFT1_9HEMI